MPSGILLPTSGGFFEMVSLTQVREVRGVRFPILPIKLKDTELLNRLRFQTTNVNADAIRIGTGHIKRFDTADSAKVMPGRFGIESVFRELVRSGNEPEPIRGNDQVQVPGFLANTAIAVMCFDDTFRLNFKPDGTAMASTSVKDKFMLFSPGHQ